MSLAINQVKNAANALASHNLSVHISLYIYYIIITITFDLVWQLWPNIYIEIRSNKFNPNGYKYSHGKPLRINYDDVIHTKIWYD